MDSKRQTDRMLATNHLIRGLLALEVAYFMAPSQSEYQGLISDATSAACEALEYITRIGWENEEADK